VRAPAADGQPQPQCAQMGAHIFHLSSNSRESALRHRAEHVLAFRRARKAIPHCRQFITEGISSPLVSLASSVAGMRSWLRYTGWCGTGAKPGRTSPQPRVPAQHPAVCLADRLGQYAVHVVGNLPVAVVLGGMGKQLKPLPADRVTMRDVERAPAWLAWVSRHSCPSFARPAQRAA
jgi:hypothetical protein